MNQTHAPTVPKLSARSLEKSIARDLRVVMGLVLRGEVVRAHETLNEALHAVAMLPRSRYARELRARAKIERARLGWYAAGVDPASRLDAALELALEARREMGDIPPPLVRAEVASLIAGIACDIGDGTSLERARAAVIDCTATLLAEGATIAAAPLLVDRAALELRGGDARGVSEHLDRAMDLLEERSADAPSNLSARLYLAGARHLLGRLPLHGRIAGGTSAEATLTALEYCRLAETTYAGLGRRHELVRVLDTTARLEALRGRTADARIVFERAIVIADDIADLIGLARATAGLAEVLASSAPAQALTLLATSIELNCEKGSRIGLAADEAALARIDDALGKAPREAAFATALECARTQLEEAIAETES